VAVLHNFLDSIPFAFWLLLVLVVAGTAYWARPRTAASRVAAEPSPGDHRSFAGEVADAAERAAATAERRRAEWVRAQEQLATAWTAFEAADQDARRTHAATAFPLMSRRRKPGENRDRERYLHHAATVACREREISIAQLNDVYAHRGWNPRLHPVVQEAALRAAAREHRFAAYRTAQERERGAWRAAERAAEALKALRIEAATAMTPAAVAERAADEVRWAEPWSTGELPAIA
jgi:hypothetical protein